MMADDELQILSITFRKKRPREHINDFFAPKNGLLKAWSKCRIELVSNNNFYLVKFVEDVDETNYEFPEYQIAPNIAPEMQLMRETRVIATLNSSANSKHFYAGVVGETLSRSNNYEYLIFFDNGNVRYVPVSDVRVVNGNDRWMHAHQNVERFFRHYFIERNATIVSATDGAAIKVEYNGEWYTGRIKGVHEKLIHILYDEIDRSEWIYRGSLRLEEIYSLYSSNELIFKRKISEDSNNNVINMHDDMLSSIDHDSPIDCVDLQTVADTIALPESPVRMRAMDRCRQVKPDKQVGYLPPKNRKKHICDPRCCTSDSSSKKNTISLSKFGPLMRPMIMGWKRVSRTMVTYVAPCGISISSMNDLKTYLAVIDCKTFDVDNFCFDTQVDCFREHYTNYQFILSQDISNGIEARPVRVINAFNKNMPDEFVYKTRNHMSQDVAKHLADGRGQSMSCCDCEDDCSDRGRCSCWQLTMPNPRNSLEGFGYEHKRLLSFISSGIFECNEKCKCSDKCSNRVAQLPVKNNFEVFMTPKTGWGVRCLNDLPRGAFVCCYFGDLVGRAQEEALRHTGSYSILLSPIKQNANRGKGISVNNPPRPEPESSRNSVAGNDLSYIIDANQCGNFSRFFNRSREPNMFLQSVFIDTHDTRFPQIAFFTKKPIKAGTALAWN